MPPGKSVRKQQEARERMEAKKAERRERAVMNELKKRRYGDADWDSDFRKFLAQLRPLGLFIRDVAGDGNCLFRSIADQLGLGVTEHETVRERVCDFVLENRVDYEPFVEDDEPFDRYVAKMRRPGTWGGQVEIQACSMAYRVNIHIFQLGQPRWEVVNWTDDEAARPTPLLLAYHDGEHYNSVRPLADMTPKEAARMPPIDMGAPTKETERGKKDKEKEEPPNKKETIIMQTTGVRDLAMVRRMLVKCHDDMDSVMAEIFGQQAEMMNHVTASDDERDDGDRNAESGATDEDAEAEAAIRAVQRAEEEEARKAEEKRKAEAAEQARIKAEEERRRAEEERKKAEKLKEKMNKFGKPMTNKERREAAKKQKAGEEKDKRRRRGKQSEDDGGGDGDDGDDRAAVVVPQMASLKL